MEIDPPSTDARPDLADKTYVTADDHQIYVSLFAYYYLDPDGDPDKDVLALDGTEVSWVMQKWNPDAGVDGEWEDWDQVPAGETDPGLGAADTAINGGEAAVQVQTGTLTGDTFRVAAILPHYGDTRFYSGPLVVAPGKAAQIQFESPLNPPPPAAPVAVAPGETFQVTATVRDQYGNLVQQGETEVYWYDSGLAELGTVETATDAQGKVRANVTLSEVVEDQDPPSITLEVDGYSDTYQIDNSPVVPQLFVEVTGGGSGVPDLDIDALQTVTLRARFRHASGRNVSGLPVAWLTTNGTLQSVQSTTNDDGEATAVLSTQGGKPGPAVVSAVLSGGGYGAHGEVHFRASNSVELKAGYLPFDDAAGFNMDIFGPANGTARVTLQPVELELAQYAFEEQIDVLTASYTPDSVFGRLAFLNNVAPGTAWQETSGIPAAPGLSCRGSRCAVVPPDYLYTFKSGWVVEAWVKPDDPWGSGAATATVVGKDGEFKLYLDNPSEPRFKFTVTTPAGDTTVYSPIVGSPDCPPDAWGGYQLRAVFAEGQISLTVNGTVVGQGPVVGVLGGGLTPIGIGTKVTGAFPTYIVSDFFVGVIDQVRLARLVRLRVPNGPDVNLGPSGQATVSVELEGGPDTAAPTDAEPDTINGSVVSVPVLVEITDASGTQVASVSENIYVTSARHGANVGRSTGAAQTVLQFGWALVKNALKEQLLSPLRSIQYLCSLPTRDEIDWGQAGAALWDVICTLGGPLGRLAQLKKIRKLAAAAGKAAKVLKFLTRLAGRAQQIANLIGYIALVEFIYDLGETAVGLLNLVIESRGDLQILQLLYEALDGNDRPVLKMIFEDNPELQDEEGQSLSALPGRRGLSARKHAAHASAPQAGWLRSSTTRRNRFLQLVGKNKKDQAILKRILDNPNFSNPSNPRLHFPKECLTKILAAAAARNVRGFMIAFKRLQQENTQVLGNLAEIVCGLQLGDEFGGLGEFNRITGKTDDDWVGKDGSAHQVKHSNKSGDAAPPYTATRNWCTKRKRQGLAWSQIVIHGARPYADLPPRLKRYLEHPSRTGIRYQPFCLDAQVVCPG